MKKYLKVVDGTKSNAGGFEYKIGEINIAKTWNINSLDPIEMGGFNFSVEDKILRWLHRGDTLYDVEIPEDAEIIDCSGENCPNGVFRSNKIIINNPRKITEHMAMSLYKKANLPIKTFYQCIVVMLYKNYLNVAKTIIKDKVNKNNKEACIQEFERMISDHHDGTTPKFDYNKLWNEAKEIYNLLKEI